MHTERIVASTLFLSVILLALINHLTTEELIADPEIIEKLVYEERRQPKSIDDVEPIDSLVKPILYADVKFIEKLSIPDAKATFINIMVPAILIAKKEIDFQRQQVELMKDKSSLNALDSAFINPLMSKYATQSIDELIKRMQTHPTSIVLGQAAIESGWGRSRFFKEANNIFGVWSMNSSDARIPAKFKRNGRQVYLKRYATISASIKDYFLTLGKVNAYRKFRTARMNQKDYRALIIHLDRYSERGIDYVKDLERMIRLNGFERYDHYQLDPNFVLSSLNP